MNVELGQSKVNFAVKPVSNNVVESLPLNKLKVLSISTAIRIVLLVTVGVDQLERRIRFAQKICIEVIDNQFAPTLVVITSIRIVGASKILVGTSSGDGSDNVRLQVLSKIPIDVLQCALNRV